VETIDATGSVALMCATTEDYTETGSSSQCVFSIPWEVLCKGF